MNDDYRGAASLIGSSMIVLGMRAGLAWVLSRELEISYRSASRRVTIVLLGSYLVARNAKSGLMASSHYVDRVQGWMESLSNQSDMEMEVEVSSDGDGGQGSKVANPSR